LIGNEDPEEMPVESNEEVVLRDVLEDFGDEEERMCCMSTGDDEDALLFGVS